MKIQPNKHIADDSLPEEEGLESEGFFDVMKPYKRAVITHIQDNYPDSEAVKLSTEAADMLTPDNPLDYASAISKMSPALRKIMQTVNWKKAPEGVPVKGGVPKSATRQKFEDMPEAVQSSKRNEALEQLGIKGPPPAKTPPPAKKPPTKQTGLDEMGDEFEVLPNT